MADVTSEPKATPEQIAAQVAREVQNLNVAIAPVLEAVEGYRAAREREGYSDALARRMAVDYHGGLLRAVLR